MSVELLVEDEFSIPLQPFTTYIFNGAKGDSSFLKHSLDSEKLTIALKYDGGFFIVSDDFYESNQVDLSEVEPYEESNTDSDRPMCELCGYKTFKMKHALKYKYDAAIEDAEERLDQTLTTDSGYYYHQPFNVCIHCLKDIQEGLEEYAETVPEKTLLTTI